MIKFFNIGKKTAKNVNIYIYKNEFVTIGNYKLISKEEATVQEHTNKLEIDMKRFMHGEKLTIYIRTAPRVPVPIIYIEIFSDEGKGKLYQPSIPIFPIWLELIMFINGIVTIIFISYQIIYNIIFE